MAENDDVPTPLVSEGAAASSNPFDFGDVDFDKVAKRRERAKAAKAQAEAEAAAAAAEAAAPLAQLQDVDDDYYPPGGSSTNDAAATAAAQEQARQFRKAQAAALEAKNKQEAAAAGQRSGVGSLFGLRGAAAKQGPVEVDKPVVYENLVPSLFAPTEGGEDGTAPRRQCLTVGKRKVAIWPYDDYHMIQKAYYEKMNETPPADGSAPTAAAANKLEATLPTETPPGQIPIFSRPADPPDIPHAVQGLSLTEFEKVAEERAIAIVSTWVFDAGLIDELLVHGGTGTTASGLGSSRRGGDNDHDDNTSVQTSEGVEVSRTGLPLDGSTNKMDKEIAKLRESTQRQLALINARLNDGVAATGSEVQELVNAVIATKDDMSRLRELMTYVSNVGDVEETNQFMLTKYPKLKQAINARRNLARCFRELDFFAQIPATCDRLREELHAGEWTAHEWSTLRSVCREHVELQIFLVEAEAGMKKRMLEDEEEEKARQRQRGGKSRSKFGRSALARVNNKDDLIDQFLSEQVENVWELGDEIRMRIMSGIGSSFDLAMNNPGGMVALVEAVENYEAANDEYRAVHGEEAGSGGGEGVLQGNGQSLRFTEMRSAALGELYKDFESRGLDVFRELTSQAADIAEEEEASNQQFSAVLRAANELTSEIGVVKEHMAPCFPPNWCIETLWLTCVSYVCSSNILQQIGGPDGHKLPDLTVTQLLDLVAWVETFREIIEETFPNIAEISSKKTYFDKPPQLLVDNGKHVDLDMAKDSLAWVNTTLWDVHDLAKDEFLFRTKEQTEEWLNNVYDAEHEKSQTAEGLLITSLCEDVYALAGVQLRTIRERLTRRSEALVQAVSVIFKNLYEKQISAREDFCTDLETCCASSNDFFRMSEKCDEIVNEIKDECNLSPQATETLEEQAAYLLGLYSGDAVYAAQKTHLYCFEPIEEAIADELFREEWLHNLTQNELALTLVRTLDDFMEDLETFLDEVMVLKCIEAQISSSVNFYLKNILARASEHRSSKASFFSDNETAIMRMKGDVLIMREYFEGIAETMPTLERVIENEFGFLDAILEILSIAAGVSNSEVHDFIIVLQKRVRNVSITSYVVGDLYHLVKPQEERSVYELVQGMESDMMALAPTDEKAADKANDRHSVPGIRVDQMLAEHISRSDRKRPLEPGAMERAGAALNMWRSGLGKSKDEDDL